jgi:hypothetical protein
MKTPNNSIGANTIRIWHPWHPENMTNSFVAVRFVIKNVITANANVMVKLQHFIPKASTQNI